MKYLNKLSTQIGISLFIMVVLSFFWWQTKFSTKNNTINLNDNKSKASLNIEEAKYSGFSENGQKFSISAKLITENKSKINVLNLKNPKAIFFDTDNTLYDYYPANKAAEEAVCKKAENLLGVSRKDFFHYYKLAKKYFLMSFLFS